MPRVVKRPDVRRGEILSAAYMLFVRHGYEATTVNMIIDALGLSKGAFYHHFESKEEVLQALARRISEEACERLKPIVERTDISALDKLNLLFSVGARFKKEHLPMVHAMADIYCREENLRLRSRILAEAIEVGGPLYTQILEDGRRDGSFHIDDAAETARLIVHLGTYLHDVFGEAYRRAATDLPGAVAAFSRHCATYTRALERILGVRPGALALMDDDTIALFLDVRRS